MLGAATRLGPYEIVAPLGAGGMGEVYRARDTRLGRQVAIKVLPEAFATNPDRQGRFEREARAVAALSHPNILAIHDYGTQGTVTYAVVELLDGETLRARLAKGPLPWREAVEIGAAIADGLAAAHAKGIIHRDLKPENLFLTADGRVKILDFGLARMDAVTNAQAETGPYVPAATDSGTVMGTAGYMSPEQVRGLPADARSDIFSFGCVLYEIVTGRRAFQRETGAETMTAVLHDEPADPTIAGDRVPAELVRIIRQCLAKSPGQRLQSAHDLAIALRATVSDPNLHHVPPARPYSSRLVAGIAAALLIGVIGTSLYFLNKNQNPSGEPALPTEAKAIESVAVLPFEDLGGDPRTEHLSESIPETVIRGLSRLQLRDLKVKSLLSVAHYKGRKPTLEEVRRELEVGVVVTGNLRVQGDDLFISVSLTDVRDGTMIWGYEYKEKMGDILTLQDRLSKDIAGNLRLRLTGEEERRLTMRGTNNPDAFQLYSSGRFYWNRRTRADLDKAIACFKDAINIDKKYALAWAGLADAYAVYPNTTDSPPSDYYSKAKEAATEALKNDDRLAEPHATLALIAAFEWKWQEAEDGLKLAIKLDPNYATARHWYAMQYLTARGQFDQAKEQLRQARELDPLSLIISAVAGVPDFYDGRYDAAIEQYRKTLEMDPNFWIAHYLLGRAYVEKRMYREALTELKAVREPRYLQHVSLMGRAYALMGQPTDARKILDELKTIRQQGRYVPACLVALVYASLGENHQALDWLETAYKEGDRVLLTLKVEPAYKDLHNEPRYLKLLADMGLADKAAARDQAIHSVAVLPFQNDTGDPKNEFLSQEIPDEIIHSLSRMRRKDLIVRPLSSVARYQGKAVDSNTVRQELKVQTIVRGSLLQAGDKLSISVSVEDVQQQKELWGRTYGKPGETIQDLRDRIARDVVAELRLQLTGDEEQRLTKRYTKNQEAYRLYLEATYYFNKVTPTGMDISIDLCRKALKEDPNYALAYLGLGRCYIILGAIYRGWRDKDYYTEAEKNLKRALDIDDTLAIAHSGLGMLYMYHDWNWKAAERELKLGADLDPDSSATQGLYGHYLAAVDRLDLALPLFRRACELDPFNSNDARALAKCHNWLHDHDKAIKEATRALRLDPNHPFAHMELAEAYVLNRMPEKAIDHLRDALKRGQQTPQVRGMLGYALAADGKKVEAQKVLDELKELASDHFGFAYLIACIYAALGDKDQAFVWLRTACDAREFRVIWIKVDPMMDNLRKQPKFAEILKEMRLPP
jgi:serine/threonine-protein kinase